MNTKSNGDTDSLDAGEEPCLENPVLERASKLFARLTELHDEHDVAGNRRLRFAYFASLVLLSFFNPTMQSLRGLQRAQILSEKILVRPLLRIFATCSFGAVALATRCW